MFAVIGGLFSLLVIVFVTNAETYGKRGNYREALRRFNLGMNFLAAAVGLALASIFGQLFDPPHPAIENIMFVAFLGAFGVIVALCVLAITELAKVATWNKEEDERSEAVRQRLKALRSMRWK